MRPLYEIDDQLMNLIYMEDGKAVDETTGELFDEEALEQLHMERETKIEHCLLATKNMNAESEMIAQEIKNLQARKKSLDNKIEWLVGYVARSLNGEKFSTPKVQVSYRNSKKVNVTDFSLLPEKYLKVKYDADLTLIKKDITAGVNVAGAEIVEKKNMQVK